MVLLEKPRYMDNLYNSIPYPPFKISEIITRKAKAHCQEFFEDANSFDPKEDISDIDSKLHTIRTNEERVQFITYLISHINDIVAKHNAKCNNANCPVDDYSQDVLYHLYGELNDYGIITDKEPFSTEETYSNNNVLNKIIQQLEELKAGQEIIYDELDIKIIDSAIEEAESLKGLQVLGRSKWLKLVSGFLVEYSGTKVLDEVFKTSIIPLALSLGEKIAKFLFLN